ncbi:[acyl-carrier-protein] S-malonyltransferase [Paenibacillus xylanexedens]|uniref:ACP S-malonyltransferase n=1 Tax=Paenibacillus xylanexedens TaxID=528191 RepID=UPI0009382ED6|nr:ACP S-malonyltransferase [Paenibacillus xylanexedens]APO47200.1 [acyl-carrier-protein] S-malonyltransferase [Paenibacillus xylanexedens]
MKKIAVLFPGQGAQYIGMGRTFYEAYPFVKDLYDEASDELGVDLAKLCFEGPISELNQLDFMLPSIFVASVASFQVWRSELGLEPDFLAGHSLGEFSALTCSGAVSFADSLRIVRNRSQWAIEQNLIKKGAMTIVENIDSATVEAICKQKSTTHEDVSIACYNGLKQFAISGQNEAVLRVENSIKSNGGVITPLYMGVAMHCSLMNEAADSLRELLARTRFTSPRWPVISNVHASPYTTVDNIKNILCEHMVQPVRWNETIEYIIAQGEVLFVDLGPKSILKALIKKQWKGIEVYAYNEKEEQTILKSLASEYRKLPIKSECSDSASRNFLEICVKESLCTKNRNEDVQSYNECIIEPLHKLKQLLSCIQNGEGKHSGNEALKLVLQIWSYKKVPVMEQVFRLQAMKKSLPEHNELFNKIILNISNNQLEERFNNV